MFDTLLNFLIQKPDNVPFAVLKGYAGTGKTTTTNELIRELKQRNYSVLVCAPTHKAVKQLRKNQVAGVDYRTIHSALALREVIDFETGAISFSNEYLPPGEEPPIEEADILILDETSMLQDELFNKLVPYMKKGLACIFVGDPVQIPPVRNKKKEQGPDCIPFLHGPSWNALITELTEVRRQTTDNPILHFVTEIRKDYKKSIYVPEQSMPGDPWKGIQIVGNATQLEDDILFDYFTSEKFKKDADYMKVIAWTNDTVNYYNSIVRKHLFGAEAVNAIMESEKLITDAPFFLGNHMFPANDEFLVADLNIGHKLFEYRNDRMQIVTHSFKVYNASCIYLRNGVEYMDTFPILHEDSQAQYNELMKALESSANNNPASRKLWWKNYFKLRDTFLKVKYNYAITAHKSQGSTYENTMVLEWDIRKNFNIEERNRILYVACSRPTNRLFVEL